MTPTPTPLAIRVCGASPLLPPAAEPAHASAEERSQAHSATCNSVVPRSPSLSPYGGRVVAVDHTLFKRAPRIAWRATVQHLSDSSIISGVLGLSRDAAITTMSLGWSRPSTRKQAKCTPKAPNWTMFRASRIMYWVNAGGLNRMHVGCRVWGSSITSPMFDRSDLGPRRALKAWIWATFRCSCSDFGCGGDLFEVPPRSATSCSDL